MPDINWGGDAASAPFKSRFDDESGNLILAETDTGTALFEWDGSAWQFRGPVEMNGEDVSGIGSLTATSGDFDSVNTEEAGRGNGNLWQESSSWSSAGFGLLEDPDDAATTDYEQIADLVGSIGSDRIPAGASLYGNLTIRPSSAGGTWAVRPRVVTVSDGDITGQTLSELEIESSSSNVRSTGWTEITSFDPNNHEIVSGNFIEGRDDTSTTSFEDRSNHALAFNWRVD